MSVRILALLLAWACAAAEDAPRATVGWRMDGTGCSDEAHPPTAWSATEHVLWSTPLPGPSASSAVVMDGRVYCCAEPETLLCLDAADGRILWQQTARLEDTVEPENVEEFLRIREDGEAILRTMKKLELQELVATNRLRKEPDSAVAQAELDGIEASLSRARRAFAQAGHAVEPGYRGSVCGTSAATPVTDGSRVWAAFGDDVTICCTSAGERVWIRQVAEEHRPTNPYASPLLVDGKLIVHFGDMNGLDPMTGKDLWWNPTEHHFGTSVAARIGATAALVTTNGDLVRLSDGCSIAQRLPGVGHTSPIVADGVAYFVETDAIAVKLPESVGGEPTVLWTVKDLNPREDDTVFLPSPVIHDGIVYALARSGMLSALDAATGAIVHRQQLEKCRDGYASMACAGGMLYAVRRDGVTLLLGAGRECRALGRNALGDTTLASPTFAGGRLYLRGFARMYCVGSDQPQR